MASPDRELNGTGVGMPAFWNRFSTDLKLELLGMK